MMQWADVLKDKSLQNLPYKIELDAKGRIIMTPASNRHGMYQIKIGALLDRMMRGGHAISEGSIETLDGVQVADVAWASNEFLKKQRTLTPFTHAPEICVEIVLSSNRRAEMDEKITLYLAKGAREVWLCDEKGHVTFHDHSGRLKKSKLVAKFPAKV